MESKLKIGDVIQIKTGGYGFLWCDVGKWVEVVGFKNYFDEDGVIVKEYDCELETLVEKGCLGVGGVVGFGSFDEDPMILLNTKEESEQPKHNHYFKDCPYDKVDVYRILSIFEVTDPCLQHLVKKGLCAGKRGHKDFRKDLQDIIDTAQRRIQMLEEDNER